jgi:hypothetical protein
VDKDSLYKILLTIILGGLGLVLFSHMPLLSNYRKIFIAILILNGILVALKIVYPLMFRKAIWGLSEWGGCSIDHSFISNNLPTCKLSIYYRN